MKIIEQSYQIETPIEALTVLRQIERAGRTCYKSEPVEYTDDGTRGFVRRIMARGHESVIEHASLTVRFITDRGVTHELVRHRLAAYSQESTRYCDYGGEDVVFIRPVWCSPDIEEFPVLSSAACDQKFTEAERAWAIVMLNLESTYNILRSEGWSPQQARAILPNSLKTEIVMTANLREWRHVFKLRCSQAAHPQIRELMRPLRNEMRTLLPEIFGTGEEESEGAEA